MLLRLHKKIADKYISRWLILLADVGLVVLAFISALVMKYSLQDTYPPLLEYGLDIAIIAVTSLTGFLIFKTFVGAVRHTALSDIIRYFKALSVNTALRLALYPLLPLQKLGPSLLILHFVFSLVTLILFRVFIKIAFKGLPFYNKPRKLKPVMIYGAGELGLLTLTALKLDTTYEYKVLGFIDDNASKKGISLSGIKVYSLSKAFKLINKREVEEVIFAIQNISAERKRRLLNVFLHKKISLRSVPSTKQWINGELSSSQIRKVNIEDLLERDPIALDNVNVKAEVYDKSILITGAAGSIGSEIARQILHYSPKRVVLLDQAESALYDLHHELLRLNSKWTDIIQLKICDVSNKRSLEKVFLNTKFDIVYHAAAYKHVPLMEDNPSEAVAVNALGTKNLADLAQEAQVEKFVFVSTDKAVNPTNVMGASKRIAEIYVQSLNNEGNTRFITTRFGNVLGSNGSVIPLFKRQLENGGPITVTDSRITRYFMTIPEACQLVLEAGAMGKGGEIFVFDMGESVKIIDVAKKMIQLSGFELGKNMHIKEIGLRPGEKLYEELLNDEENTLPTHHPKIMIGRVRKYPYDKISRDFEELEQLLQNGSNFDLVFKMKGIVPEFKSQNSLYQKLDEEISVN